MPEGLLQPLTVGALATQAGRCLWCCDLLVGEQESQRLAKPGRRQGLPWGARKGLIISAPCEQWTESLEDMRISEGRMDDIGAAWRDLRDDSEALGGGDGDDSDHDSSRRKSGSRPSQPSVIQSSMSGLWQAIIVSS
jgi:hypothetical protein